MALFDLKSNCKISADFHVDLNPPCVREMLQDNSEPRAEGTQGHCAGQSFVHGVPESCLHYIKQVTISLSPHSVSLLRLSSDLEVCCYHCVVTRSQLFSWALVGVKVAVQGSLAVPGKAPGRVFLVSPCGPCPGQGVWGVDRGSGMVSAHSWVTAAASLAGGVLRHQPAH